MVSKRFLVVPGAFALALALAGFVWTQQPPAGSDAATYKDSNELLKGVSSEVPEFGGVFLSNDQSVLNIYLSENETDATKQADAREAVEERFGIKEGLTLNVIKGNYTITQLAEWYVLMESRFLWDQEGVIMTDLDEAANQLYIGVLSLENVERVYAFLEGLDIPRQAVTVAVEEQTPSSSHTLRERAHDDKMAGGYQMEFALGDPCTMGFVAIRDGTAGMVTAGHCTESSPYDGGVEWGNQVHQPAMDNLVGYEDIDPEFSTSLSGCTDSDGCRHSDSTFVDFSVGVDYNRGWIAKPTEDGGITVNPDTAHYSITRDYGSPVVGDEVVKVGRTTGQTRGDVVRSCFKYDDYDDDDWVGTYLCQTHVDASSGGGDSGSPVFEELSGDQVRLVGIVTHGDSSRLYYSPLGRIFLDLGTNSTWDVCT